MTRGGGGGGRGRSASCSAKALLSVSRRKKGQKKNLFTLRGRGFAKKEGSEKKKYSTSVWEVSSSPSLIPRLPRKQGPGEKVFLSPLLVLRCAMIRRDVLISLPPPTRKPLFSSPSSFSHARAGPERNTRCTSCVRHSPILTGRESCRY